MRKIKWGVIGCGGIADRRTIPEMMMAQIANLGLEKACELNPGLAKGVNTYEGVCTYKNVAQSLKIPYCPLSEAMKPIQGEAS